MNTIQLVQLATQQNLLCWVGATIENIGSEKSESMGLRMLHRTLEYTISDGIAQLTIEEHGRLSKIRQALIKANLNESDKLGKLNR